MERSQWAQGVRKKEKTGKNATSFKQTMAFVSGSRQDATLRYEVY